MNSHRPSNDICEVVQNFKSTDLIQPLRKPISSQSNVGVFLQVDTNATTDYQPMQKDVANKLIALTPENRLPKPQNDKTEVWRIYREFKGKYRKTVDSPNRNNLYIRPYYYERDYLEAARQMHGKEYLKEISKVCPAIQNEGAEVLEKRDKDIQKNWSDFYGNEKTWVERPSAFPKFTAQERNERMFLVGQPYYSEAVQWYHRNYPSPTLPAIVTKFSK